VYLVLSEPWRDTGVVLDDLGSAWDAAFAARQAQREPEAGQ
jgi:hypothetical protein